MSALAQSVTLRLSADEANQRMQAGQRKALDLEGKLARQYEASLRATAKRCSEAYTQKTRVLLAAVLPSDPNSPQVPQPTVDEVLAANLAAASASARTQATRRKIAVTVAGEILAGFGPEPQLRGLLEPLVLRQAGVQAERLVAGVRESVASILLDALVNGWTVPETAAQIGEMLTADAKWRSTMLARTDLISLSNGASHAAAQILGDDGPQYKTWLTAGDERVRETHVNANRQTVPIGQSYSVGGESLQFPGDPAGSDAETIQCRCVSVFTDSQEPTLRHSQDGGIDDRVAVLASSEEPIVQRVLDVQSEAFPEGNDGDIGSSEENPGSELDELLASLSEAGVLEAERPSPELPVLSAPASLSDELDVLLAAFDPAQPRDPGGEGGGQWVDIGGRLAPTSVAYKKQRLAKIEENLATQEMSDELRQAVEATRDELRTEIEKLETKLERQHPNLAGDPRIPASVSYGHFKFDRAEVDAAVRHALSGGRRNPKSARDLALSHVVMKYAEKLTAADAAILASMATASVEITAGEPRWSSDGTRIFVPVLVAGAQVSELEMGWDGEQFAPVEDLTASIEPAVGYERHGIEVALGETAVLTEPGFLTASAAGMVPEVPPAAWFEQPEADEPTALTITADGQVYGHAALWNSCHTGMQGRCTTPPRSTSGYRFFHLGAVETEEGATVASGKITFSTGHAPLTASRAGTAAHYDNTGRVGADVVARDGKHGIWVSGALRPDLPAAAVRTLRAAALSGDWRNVNGALELIGLLAVNVPGFPVPRAQAALAASAGEEDEVFALVAAGVVEPCEVCDDEALDALLAPVELDSLLHGLTAAGFDESKHPRNKPSGRDNRESASDGGKFASQTKGASSKTNSKADKGSKGKKAEPEFLAGDTEQEAAAWAKKSGAGLIEDPVILEAWQLGQTHDPVVKAAVEKAIKDSPGLKEGITVYRVEKATHGEKGQADDRPTSTSLEKEYALAYGDEKDLYAIEVPAGTKVAYSGEEKEVIFPEGTSFDRQEDGSYTVNSPKPADRSRSVDERANTLINAGTTEKDALEGIETAKKYNLPAETRQAFERALELLRAKKAA